MDTGPKYVFLLQLQQVDLQQLVSAGPARLFNTFQGKNYTWLPFSANTEPTEHLWVTYPVDHLRLSFLSNGLFDGEGPEVFLETAVASIQRTFGANASVFNVEVTATHEEYGDVTLHLSTYHPYEDDLLLLGNILRGETQRLNLSMVYDGIHFQNWQELPLVEYAFWINASFATNVGALDDDFALSVLQTLTAHGIGGDGEGRSIVIVKVLSSPHAPTMIEVEVEFYPGFEVCMYGTLWWTTIFRSMG